MTSPVYAERWKYDEQSRCWVDQRLAPHEYDSFAEIARRWLGGESLRSIGKKNLLHKSGQGAEERLITFVFMWADRNDFHYPLCNDTNKRNAAMSALNCWAECRDLGA